MDVEPDPDEESAMLDIGKFTRYGRLNRADPLGHLFDLDDWSPQRARTCAEGEGVALTDEHWPVILGLRELYRSYGDVLTAREVSHFLDREYGGLRHLYQLFPRGPVIQASRIAGIPLPQHSADRSFGSVW